MLVKLSFSETFDNLYKEFLGYEQGEQLLKLEGIHPDQLDMGGMSYRYFTEELTEITVDNNANSNEDNCYNNYQAEITKGLHKLHGYYLLHKYAEERYGTSHADYMIQSIWQGDIYFHDATKIQIPYCYAYSTLNIMLEGRPYGQLKSVPPKRSDSFIAEVIETTMDLSQEFAGAIAIGDLIVNLCYYLKREFVHGFSKGDGRYNYVFTDTEIAYINNLFQKFIHVVNNKFRLGSESPFTNISIFDRDKLELLFGDYVYPDGSKPDFDYIMEVQKIFMEFFSKGNNGIPYRFPVVTVNLSKDKDTKPVDVELAKFTAKCNMELGAFNIYATDGTKVASCCRLVNDYERMGARQDSFGNGGLNIGSHRVVTVNLPRIAILSDGNIKQFYENLDESLLLSAEALLVHREEILKRRINSGFLKFFDPKQIGWFELDNMFSTIGITGVYEMCRYLGIDIKSEEGVSFVKEVLEHIEQFAQKCSEESSYSFNVEEIPAEGTAIKLAKKDNLLFDTKCSLYSNQYIPLALDVPYIQRIKLAGEFMSTLSGGGILHLNVKDKITNPEIMYELICKCIENGAEHFAINFGFNKCTNGHITIGGTSMKTCPHCGEPITDTMTRVVGFMTWISSWSPERAEDGRKRVFNHV